MGDDEIRVFGGSGSPRLARAICKCLSVSPGECEVLRFPEGNLFVRIGENVRGRNVYLVQSTAFPANDNFMELLFWIDALKRASAASVTAVVPYFSYAKGDKKDEPRVSIRARVCADAIEAAGADRVVTMDLHAPQIQGFFKVPVDDLYALGALCEAAERIGLADPVVVSPDIGFAKKARAFAKRLSAPLAIADKQRLDHTGGMVIHEIIGDVAGRAAGEWSIYLYGWAVVRRGRRASARLQGRCDQLRRVRQRGRGLVDRRSHVPTRQPLHRPAVLRHRLERLLALRELPLPARQ